MENISVIIDCVEFKNELHKKLYLKSEAKNFNEYIKYINSIYSSTKTYSEEPACEQKDGAMYASSQALFK